MMMMGFESHMEFVFLFFFRELIYTGYYRFVFLFFCARRRWLLVRQTKKEMPEKVGWYTGYI